MEKTEKSAKNTHHGHAIKRFRSTLRIKQEALAADMGISQALVSFYEQQKEIDDATIYKFAKALNVAPELIKDLEEDPVTVIIENNTIDNKGNLVNISSPNYYNPDPTDQIPRKARLLLIKYTICCNHTYNFLPKINFLKT